MHTVYTVYSVCMCICVSEREKEIVRRASFALVHLNHILPQNHPPLILT